VICWAAPGTTSAAGYQQRQRGVLGGSDAQIEQAVRAVLTWLSRID
jgi:hypothetical protein